MIISQVSYRTNGPLVFNDSEHKVVVESNFNYLTIWQKHIKHLKHKKYNNNNNNNNNNNVSTKCIRTKSATRVACALLAHCIRG